MTIENAGLIYGPDTAAGFSPGGDGVGPQYSNWDHSSMTMCVCDHGLTGPDCSYRKYNRGVSMCEIDSYWSLLCRKSVDGFFFSIVSQRHLPEGG